MPPTVYGNPARIRVDSAEQSLDCVVKADDAGGSACDFQVFRNKTHPGLFPGADKNDGAEKQNQVALQAQELAEPAREAGYVAYYGSDESNVRHWITGFTPALSSQRGPRGSVSSGQATYAGFTLVL